ncbi:hypothetical protein Taro_023189 [Colocasia esculenta]|uniref:Uncharacterized protein n=1 Tax=Colocasia esculenta TaxID=4460 RepID=A0A843VGM9_COLES|nr:hypothetical protein [Colocasia esculenta]
MEKLKGLETLKKMRGYNNAKLNVQIDMEFLNSGLVMNERNKVNRSK